MESATATRDRSGTTLDEGMPPPEVAREETPAFPVTWVETLAIFVLFGLFYTLLGFRIVADLHVVNFDALDRLTRAFMVWYNDPPKLAAIGFAFPPLASFVLVPFAAVRALVTSGLALPLSSALFAAGALTFFNRTFAAADMARGARLLLVLLIGLNPMFAFYAMNGTGDAAYMLFASFALFALVAWGRSGSARYLIAAGLAVALAALTKYEFIAWAFMIAFIIAWTLNARERDKSEVEASTIAYMAPIAYALGIWIFFNAVVLGNPFEWVTLAGESAPVNAVASAAPGFDLLDALGNVLRIQLIFPATLVAVPLLLLNAGGSRGPVAIGFVLLLAVNIAYGVISAAVEGSVNVIELRDALPAMMIGIAGFAWLYLQWHDARPLVYAALAALCVLALPTAWSQMKSYPHQNLEEAFTRAVATGDDQEGSASRGGFQVGIAPENEMAKFIDDQEIPDRAILTDNSRTYGVIALTGHPELFFDRVDEGDAVWLDVLEEPQDEVEFMLVERSDADLIADRYPGAIDGEVPFLETIVSNDRYVLFGVVEGAVADTGETEAAGETGEGSAPSTIPEQGGGSIGSAPPLTDQPPPGSELF
jgi:hypothetical protein